MKLNVSSAGVIEDLFFVSRVSLFVPQFLLDGSMWSARTLDGSGEKKTRASQKVGANRFTQSSNEQDNDIIKVDITIVC